MKSISKNIIIALSLLLLINSYSTSLAASSENTTPPFQAVVVDNISSIKIKLFIKIDSKLETTIDLPPNEILRIIDLCKKPSGKSITVKGFSSSLSKKPSPFIAKGPGVYFQFNENGSAASVSEIQYNSLIIKKPAFAEIFMPNIENITIEQLHPLK